MGKPTLYVRELDCDEVTWLDSVSRTDTCAKAVRRAQVILASAQGVAVPTIAKTLGFTPLWTRRIIHEFDEKGCEAIYPDWQGGRPPVFSDEARAQIASIAVERPRDHGKPFSHWSLPKLAAYAVEVGIVESISHETVRQILQEKEISLQRIKTWKQSNDPNFAEKKNHRSSSGQGSGRQGRCGRRRRIRSA